MTTLADAFDSTATRRAARAALTAARPDAAVADCRPLGRGNRKETALVALGDSSESPERVVVQAAADAAVRTERALLEAVAARTSVPVPTVLAAERTDGAAALVTEYVAGADLHEEFVALGEGTQTALVGAFGRHLAELHDAFVFDAHGAVTAGDGSDRTLTASGDDWSDWFASYARAGLDRLPAAFDDLREDLATLFAEASPVVDSPPRLFPWDFRPGNALAADGDLVAVLDWEAPLAAPPALSVAKATYLVADWYVEAPRPLRGAFRAGYESVRPVPSVRPVHRVAAVCRCAVDSNGVVTNPRYPELDRPASVSFHRRALERALADAGD